MDSVTTAVSTDDCTLQLVLDTDAIPLELLAADAGVRRMVTDILANIEESSHVRVTAFNSAI